MKLNSFTKQDLDTVRELLSLYKQLGYAQAKLDGIKRRIDYIENKASVPDAPPDEPVLIDRMEDK